MAHYDIFREQLGIKYPAHGHALWETSPGRLYGPVEVGDVGYIREGKFHRLFNALLPADHPSHRRFGVPEYHEPLTPYPSEHIDVGTVSSNHYCSQGITVVDAQLDTLAASPDDLSQISYLCRRRQQGAVLFLPMQAQRQDTIARGDFGKWIIKHIERWFAFTRQLGLGIEQMEDIILVTGCHRTRSSLNVAFLESHADAQVSFGADVAGDGSPEVSIRWRSLHKHIRGAMLSWGPSGENLPEDQCIFLRGFRVTRTLRILPKHLIAAAEPSSDRGEYNNEPELELTSMPATPRYRDPLHQLLVHVAEQIPDCDMVLVHDDDLARIGEICDGNNSPSSDRVTHLLQKNEPKIQQLLCDRQRADEYSSETGQGTVKVAMFSEEFETWKDLSPSQSADTQLIPDIRDARSVDNDHFAQDPLVLQLRVKTHSSVMSPQRRDSPSQSAAKLIRGIRAAHGFDNDKSAQDPAIVELRGKLEHALQRLSNDLYNKKIHFLLEFIQNADDNAYGDNVIPTLRLRIADRIVAFECNELGFSDANVKAICDIGASTKTREKNPRGFIGEKGIGFKSVFTVANVVYITSGAYSFYFDKTAPLGMITPALHSKYSAMRGWTTFHLHLAPSENGNDLSAQFGDVSPTLLLFLRKLRALSISIPRHGIEIEVRRTDHVDRDMVSLERVQNGKHVVESYILVRHLAQTPAEEPGREDVKESEIVLAFPVTENREPVTKNQDVHAFLPLRCHGFKFIIQADFITSASREDVLADKPWNQALRGSVVDAFFLAIEQFQNDPRLCNVWFRYLPESISDNFFSHVEHQLMATLKGKRILHATDGTYLPASQLFFLPWSFCDDTGAPLIPEAYLPPHQRYLSPDYDIHPESQDRRILHRLGVREMTDDDFLTSLALMDKADLLRVQSDTWHDAVASLLLRLPPPPHGTIRNEVLSLRIIPLHNGNWARAALASTFMFPPGVSIPDDLGLQSIAPRITKFSPRYHLFVRLRVMPPNPVTIAKKILTATGPRSVAARVTHARFFFDHRMDPNMPPAMSLSLVDEQGKVAQGHDLYLDLVGEDGALALRDALSPAARFLHPDFFSAYSEATEDEIEDEETGEYGTNNGFGDARSEWLDWLRDRVGLNVVPRVINGQLSPEFLDHAPALEGRALLASLRVWWPRLGQRLTEAGARALGAISIAGRRLDTLYLPRGALARIGEALELPCIPVDNPEDHAWDFLELLGVATRMNASFFVNKLVHMQARGEKDNKLVEDIYKQLDARFDEDEMLIKKAFKEYPILLLSVNHETDRVWLHKIDVYWHGPPSMRSKAIISRSYPHLSNFFFNKLGIPHAPPFALVDELRLLAERHRSGHVPPEVQVHVAEILADISDVIQSMPKIPQSFASLAQIAVFPVQVPDEGIALRSANEFYVPDRSSKYADVFRGRVPLLDLPDSVPMTRIRPLLDSDIFKDKILYLDPNVTKRSVPNGRKVLDTAATELYSSRVAYMARLVLHNSKKSDIPPDQTKIFTKLHKMTVINVPTITTTLTVGSCIETTSDDVAFEETDDRFTVFVSNARSLGKSINPPVCKSLSNLLEVDMMLLFTCITQPVDVVDIFLELSGIAEIPVDDSDGHDRSWLQAITQPNMPVASKSGISEHSQFMGSSRSSYSPGPTEAAEPTNPTRDIVRPPSSNFGAPVPTEESEIVEIMGEHFVYKLLVRTLDDFGPDNWTSELRHLVPGFTPFQGQARADFTYVDSQGQLTRMWLGLEKAAAWQGPWPRYHIEVKSTRGDESEPFLMSPSQMATAFALSERVQPGADVYVIMHVLRIGTSEPTYVLYSDLHRALTSGHLKFVGDTYLQRNSQSPV